MGFVKRFEEIHHTTYDQAANRMGRFYTFWLLYGYIWKNYVINDHVRFIVEMTPKMVIFGRSKLRSYHAFADPLELEDLVECVGYFGKYNPKIGKVEILGDTNRMSWKEYRATYLKYGGTARW